MTIFALVELKEIKGKFKFYTLISNGTSQYLEALNELNKEGNYQSELNTLQTRIQAFAEGQRLPATKLKKLKGDKDGVPEFELKTKHLRLYIFNILEDAKVIVLLGKKTTQNKDIRKFRNIKAAYFRHL
jgi:hypothetical protein